MQRRIMAVYNMKVICTVSKPIEEKLPIPCCGYGAVMLCTLQHHFDTGERYPRVGIDNFTFNRTQVWVWYIFVSHIQCL